MVKIGFPHRSTRWTFFLVIRGPSGFRKIKNCPEHIFFPVETYLDRTKSITFLVVTNILIVVWSVFTFSTFQNHPDKDFITCPFNARHMFLRSDLRKHLSHCADRVSISFH